MIVNITTINLLQYSKILLADLIMKVFFRKSIFFVLLAFSTSVWPALMLDQSFDPHSYAGSVVSSGSNYIHAQTFTSSLSGELAQVDIFVSRFLGLPTENLNIMILDTNLGGVPDINQILASVSLSPLDVPESAGISGGAFVSLDVSAFHIPVATGETLAITAQTDESFSALGPMYSWEIGLTSDPYPGGNLFISNDSGINFYPTGSPSGSADVGFRTYVNISPIPEPETYAMLVSGLFIVGFMRQRNNIS